MGRRDPRGRHQAALTAGGGRGEGPCVDCRLCTAHAPHTRYDDLSPIRLTHSCARASSVVSMLQRPLLTAVDAECADADHDRQAVQRSGRGIGQQSRRHLCRAHWRQRAGVGLGADRISRLPGTGRHRVSRLHVRPAPRRRRRPYRGDRQRDAQADAGGQTAGFGRLVLLARPFDAWSCSRPRQSRLATGAARKAASRRSSSSAG